MAGFDRNRWPPSVGIAGRLASESLVAFRRNTQPDEYDRWLTAPIEDVIAFQFHKPFPAKRMAMERTDELWVPMSERSGRPRKQKDLRIV